MATEFARSQFTGLSSAGHDAGTLSEILAKTVQRCRAEDCLAIDVKIYHTSLLIRQSCHFEEDFDRVLLQHGPSTCVAKDPDTLRHRLPPVLSGR